MNEKKAARAAKGQQARVPAKVPKSLKGKQVQLDVSDDESTGDNTYSLPTD